MALGMIDSKKYFEERLKSAKLEGEKDTMKVLLTNKKFEIEYKE